MRVAPTRISAEQSTTGGEDLATAATTTGTRGTITRKDPFRADIRTERRRDCRTPLCRGCHGDGYFRPYRGQGVQQT